MHPAFVGHYGPASSWGDDWGDAWADPHDSIVGLDWPDASDLARYAQDFAKNVPTPQILPGFRTIFPGSYYAEQAARQARKYFPDASQAAKKYLPDVKLPDIKIPDISMADIQVPGLGEAADKISSTVKIVAIASGAALLIVLAVSALSGRE